MSKSIARSKFIFAAKLSLIIALGLSSAALAEVNLPIADSLDPNVTTQIKTTVNNNDTLQVIHNGAANQTFNNSWKSFDVPENKYVDFNFSNAGQVSVNKITGGNASQIYGHITQSGAGGTVYLINSSGVLFGRNSSVNLNSFAVSTYDLKPQDIQNKKFVFGGVNQNSIVNQGNINVSEGGFAAFLAPVIENTGSINASKGTIALVSGKDVTFNMNDGQQISLELDKSTVNNLVLDSNKAQIENAGLLKADKVNELINNVVNNTGVIEANTLTMEDGQLAFGKVDINGGTGNTTIAGEINTKGKSGGFIDINSKNTYINGKLNAFGETGKGGTIKVLGDEVRLLGSSSIDASGDQGGGTVLIGGDNHGEGSIRTADYTFVGKDVNLNANAITSGDGGKVIVWANDLTRYFGNISAKGGLLSGNGGFAEVSGKKYLNFYGNVDLSSYKGKNGTLLLDPTNITIVSGAIGVDNGELADSQILAANRAGENLTISEITLEGLAAAANIRLEATNDITLSPLADHLLNLKSTWPSSLTIIADSDNNGIGTFSMDSADTIRTEGGNIDITGAILNISNLNVTGAAGNKSGSIYLTGKSQVNTAASTTLNAGVWLTISGSSTGSINLGNSTTLYSDRRDINISSGSGTINVASGVNLNTPNGSIDIRTEGAGGNITLGALNLNGDLTVDTNNHYSPTPSDIILQGDITSTRSIVLYSARSIIFNPGADLTTMGAGIIGLKTGHQDGGIVFNNTNSINSAGNLTISSDYNLASILDPGYSINTTGDLRLISREAPIVIPEGTNLFNNANSVDISTEGAGTDITLPALNLTKPLYVSTNLSQSSDIILQGDLTSTSHINLGSGRSIIFNQGVDLTTTGAGGILLSTFQKDGDFIFNNTNSISAAAGGLAIYSDYNLASMLDTGYSINTTGDLYLSNYESPIVIPEGTTFGNANSVYIETGGEGADITLPALNLNKNLTVNAGWGSASSDIILQGNLSSTGSIDLTSDRSIIFNPDIVVSAGGNLTASATNGVIKVNPGGAGTNTLELKSGGTLTLNNILDASNSIESVKLEGQNIASQGVNTTGSVIYNDTRDNLSIDQAFIDLYGSGDLTVSSAGTLSLGGDINSTRNITLTGTDLISGGFGLNTTGNFIFTDPSGVLNINQAYIDSFGTNDITINWGNAIYLIQDINTNKNITLQGTNILHGGFTLSTPGAISLYDTDADLSINQAYVNAFGTSDLSIRSAGILSLGGNINSTRNINLTGTNINSGGFNLNTSGNVVLNDTVGALSINQAYIDSFGTNDLTINSVGLIDLSGDINTNRNITLGSNGFDTTNSYYFNHGTGSLTFNDTTFDINARLKGSGNINATGKNITLTGLDSALNINNITSTGAVSIELKDGDTNSGNISIGTINADSVLIQNNKSAVTSNIILQGDITCAGNIDLVSARSIIFNPGADLTTTGSGSISLTTRQDGAFTFDTDILNRNTITSSRGINITSDYNLASILNPTFRINATDNLRLTNCLSSIVIPVGTTFGTTSAVLIRTAAEGADITLPTLNLNKRLTVDTDRSSTTSDIILQGDITSSDNIELSSARSIKFDSGVDLTTTGSGSISLFTRRLGTFTFDNTNIITSSRDLNICSENDLNSILNPNFNITAMRSVLLEGNNQVLNIPIDMNYGNTGTLKISSLYAPLTILSGTNFGNSDFIHITTSSDNASITLGTLNLTASFNAGNSWNGIGSRESDIILTGNINSTAGVTIDSGRSIIFQNGVSIATTGSGDIALMTRGTNGLFEFDNSNSISSSRDLNIYSEKQANSILNAAYSISSTRGFNLSSDGTVNIPDGMTFGNATSINIYTSSDNASITLGSLDLTASLNVGNSWHGLSGRESDIILAGDIKTTSGISFDSGRSLVFQNGASITTTGSGDITLTTRGTNGLFEFDNSNSISSDRDLNVYSETHLNSIINPDFDILSTRNVRLEGSNEVLNVPTDMNYGNTGAFILNSWYAPLTIADGTNFGNANSIYIGTRGDGSNLTVGSITTIGDLLLNSNNGGQADLIIHGDLTSTTGNIDLESSKSIIIDANVDITAARYVDVISRNGGNISINPGTAAYDTLNITAGRNLILSGTLDASNSIDQVSLTGQDINTGNIVTPGSVIYNDTLDNLGGVNQAFINRYGSGDLTIKSAGTLTLTETINSTRDINLTGADINSGGFNLNTSGDVVLSDTSGVLNINQAYIDAFGLNDLTINSVNAISLIGNINTNKNITLQGTNILDGGFTLNTPGSVSLYDTAGALNINQGYVDAFGTGNLSIRSAGILSLGGNINSTRNINLTGTNINSGGFNLNTSGNVILTDTLGALSINQAYINSFGTGDLTINSSGLMDLSGDINTNRNITLGSNGFDTTNSYFFNHGTGTLTFNDSTFDINARLKGSGNVNATGKNITLTGLDSALNINNITSTGAVSIKLKDGDTNSGNISIGTINADSVLIQNNKSAGPSDIIINNGGSITAAGAGDSLVLSTVKGNFINNSGAGALSANNGRWFIYSSYKTDTVLGGLVGTESTGKNYILNPPASIIGAGNQIVYSNGVYGAVYTVTVTNFSKVYGSNNPIFTYGISNAADGDTITGTALLSCAATNASSVGLFTITASLGTLSSAQGNSFEFVDGTLTITQKDITIKADDKSKTYGAANPIFTSTFTGLVNGDVASDFGLTYNVAGNPVNAGTYNNSITPSALSGAKSSNYNVTAYQTGNFVINPKALSIVADNKSKTYGSPNPIFTGTVLGLVNGDTEAGIGVNYTSPAILTSNVGTYNIIPSITSTNYSPTYTNGTLTINPAIPVAPVTPPSDPVNPEVIKDVTAPVDNNTQKDLGQNNNTQAEDPVKPDENNDQEIKQGIDNPTLPINNSSEEETTGSSEKDTVNSNELTIKSYNYQDFDPDELKRSYELLLKAVNYSNEPDLEYQADKEAVLYLKEAGYSPKAINAYLMLVKVLEDLKSKENLNEIKKDPLGFERHPKTSSRIIKIQNLIKKENLEQYSKKNLQRKSYDNFVKNNQDVLELTPKIKEIINYIHLKNTQYIY